MEGNGPLIEADALHELIVRGERLTVMDVRWREGDDSGERAYWNSHIPGAVYVPLDQAFSGPPGQNGRHPLPDRDRFEKAMRRAGVSNSVRVVVYDDGKHNVAARAWWCLRYFGHSHAQVLNGGFAHWQGKGLPVTSHRPEVPDGDFTAEPGMQAMIGADGAAQLAADGFLVDVRPAERYSGEYEPVDPRGGHIPGAINIPTSENIDADGLIRKPAELRELFDSHGLKADDHIGVYCGSGVAGAFEVLALESVGIPSALYVGSWSDWVADKSRPVAEGSEPST